jgi:hypothetical protein
MSGKSGPRKKEEELKIPLGAKMSKDPEPTLTELPCHICGGNHPNHATTGGD